MVSHIESRVDEICTVYAMPWTGKAQRDEIRHILASYALACASDRECYEEAFSVVTGNLLQGNLLQGNLLQADPSHEVSAV